MGNPVIPYYPDTLTQIFYATESKDRLVLKTQVRLLHNDVWKAVLVVSDYIVNKNDSKDYMEAMKMFASDVYRVQILYQCSSEEDTSLTRYNRTERKDELQISEKERLLNLLRYD